MLFRNLRLCTMSLLWILANSPLVSALPDQSSATATQPMPDALPTPSDYEETRFIAVNYCNQTQEQIIRRSAAEAKRVLEKASQKLTRLWKIFETPSETGQPEAWFLQEHAFWNLIQPYVSFWDAALVLPRERYRTLFLWPSAAEETWYRAKRLSDQLADKMLPNLRKLSPVLEITCGDSWIIRPQEDWTLYVMDQFQDVADETNLPTKTNEFGEEVVDDEDENVEYIMMQLTRHMRYDNRTSDDPGTTKKDRFWVEEDIENPRARYWHTPMDPNVLSLNISLFDEWAEPYKNMEEMRTRAEEPILSLDDINTSIDDEKSASSAKSRTHRMDVLRKEYRLQNRVSLETIINDTLTGIFLHQFPLLNELTNDAPLTWDKGFTSFKQVRVNSLDWIGKDPYNFAYLVLALYLDNWEWNTGRNLRPPARKHWRVRGG